MTDTNESKRVWLEGRSPEDLDDKTLFRRVESASYLQRTWRNRLNGLIFVVHARGLVTRAGMKDIFEYGARKGGMTRDKVNELIRIGNALEGAPRLRRVFLRGEVGWSKIRTVLTEVTPATDAFWAAQVSRLPKRALETLVQERKSEATRVGMSPGSSEWPASISSPPQGASVGSPAPPSASGPPDRVPSPGPDRPCADPHSADPHSADPQRAHRDGGQNRADGSRDDIPGKPGQSAQRSHPTDAQRAKRDCGQQAKEVGCDTIAQRSHPTDGSPDLSTESHGAGPLLARVRVTVDLDPVLADKVSFVQGELSRREGRRFSFRETLDRMVAAYQGEPDRPSKYLKVVVVDEAAGRTYVRTTRGDVDLEPGKIEGERRAGAPIEMAPSELRTAGHDPGQASPSRGPGGDQPSGAGRGRTGAAGHDPGQASPSRGPGGDQPSGAGRGRIGVAGHDPAEDDNDPASPEIGLASPGRRPAPAAHPGPGRPSRYVPASVARRVLAASGGLCEFPGCRRLGAVRHHVRRFGLDPRHDPDGIRLLCEAHHDLAHTGLIANEDDPTREWRLRPPGEFPSGGARERIDGRLWAERSLAR